MSVYNGIRPPDAKGLMVSHDEKQIIYIVDKNNVYKKWSDPKSQKMDSVDKLRSSSSHGVFEVHI